MTCQSDAAACHESLDPCPILCPASSFDVLFNWCGGVDRWVSFLEQLGRGIKVPVVMEIVSFDHCQLSFVHGPCGNEDNREFVCRTLATSTKNCFNVSVT